MPRQEKPLTQNQVIDELAVIADLAKIDVRRMLIAQNELAARQLMKRGIGVFKIPFIGLKLALKKKPATKVREGRNPATGETIMIAAKPASKAIKVTVLKKGLKTDVLG